MKIAVTGAHGVGKTTLARALTVVFNTADGWSTVMTPEVPRVVCELAGDPTFFRRGVNNPLKQLVLLYGQVQFETEAAKSRADVVVCDRTIVDHWIYSAYLFSDAFHDAGVFDVCEKLVARHCATYDRLYRLPIEFPPFDDGTREGDEDFQRAIDSMIVTFLDRNGIGFLTVRGTVEERRDTIAADLRRSFSEDAEKLS